MAAKRAMSRRRFLTLTGVAAGATTLAACAGTPQVVEKVVKETVEVEKIVKETVVVEKQVTVEVLAKGSIPIAWWVYPQWDGITGEEAEIDGKEPTALDWPRHVSEQFMEMHPEVRVDLELMDWGTGRQKVNVAAAAGLGPDVWWEDNGEILKFALQGVLEPIDDALTGDDLEDFQPWAIEHATIAGKIWYWPWVSYTTCVMANRALFAERGAESFLPPEDNRKWDYNQFLEALKEMTFDRDGDGTVDVYGYAIPCQQNPGDYHRHNFLWGRGARIFSPEWDRITLYVPEAVEGLQYMQDLEHRHQVIPAGSAAMSNSDAGRMWNEGRLALYPAEPGIKFQLEKAMREGTIPEGLIELYPVFHPSQPPNEPVEYSGEEGIGVFKQKDPGKLGLVMEFARFLTNTENQKAIKPLKYFPVRKSAGNLYPDDEFMEFMATTLAYAGPDTSVPYYYGARQFFVPMYQEVMSLQRTPEEALQFASSEAQKWLDEQLAQRVI
ncbi:MAG: extracellular solute-binding protein [Anaerolineae bacterium]|nr:extracellular solute-binding protein [Anaerolineae bacterium]